MTAIKCLACGQTVRHDPTRLVGCFCDSDAPTWCAIARDGRLMTFTASKWEAVSDE
jgi:hypothetical protein